MEAEVGHSEERAKRLSLARARIQPSPIRTPAVTPHAVIDLMEREPRQALDIDGKCGGVVALPNDLKPFFVGDLHARLDNLLVILTQNGFLDALEQGTAALIFLGDAVHSDEEGEEERMDSSVLMMDIVFRL